MKKKINILYAEGHCSTREVMVIHVETTQGKNLTISIFAKEGELAPAHSERLENTIIPVVGDVDNTRPFRPSNIIRRDEADVRR